MSLTYCSDRETFTCRGELRLDSDSLELGAHGRADARDTRAQ